MFDPKEERRTKTIRKVTFSIGSANLRLSAKVGKNLTFIGGEKDQGYFKSFEAAEAYIAENKEKFEKVTTMNSLLKIFFYNK